MKRSTDYIVSRISISQEEIWRLLPHKRNEKFFGMEWIPHMQLYHVSSIKKKYRRRKK